MSGRISVKNTFFDLGGTLADVPLSVDQIWLELLKDLGQRVDSRKLEQAIREADQLYGPRVYDFKGRMESFWNLYDGFVLDRMSISDPEGMLCRAIERGFDQPKWFRLYSESRETLETLKSLGYKLALISDNTDDLHKHLSWLDLRKYFDGVTYSQEVGAEKPNPAIFQLALKRAQCWPEESVYVGNSYEKDVVGARGVGITPILIDRDNRYPNVDCRRIRDLRELQALLEHGL